MQACHLAIALACVLFLCYPDQIVPGVSPTGSSGCLLPREGWRSLLSCRLLRLARMLLTSLEAVAFSRRASLSLNSSCMQHIACRSHRRHAACCMGIHVS